jgi:hypothetical protein
MPWCLEGNTKAAILDGFGIEDRNATDARSPQQGLPANAGGLLIYDASGDSTGPKLVRSKLGPLQKLERPCMCTAAPPSFASPSLRRP